MSKISRCVHHLYPPSSNHPHHVPSFPRCSWCQWWGLQTDCLADGISWCHGNNCCRVQIHPGKREKLMQLNIEHAVAHFEAVQCNLGTNLYCAYIYIYICTMDLYVLFERLHVERVLVKLYLFLENPY